MKKMTVEIVKESVLEKGAIEIAGRCVEGEICVGDSLNASAPSISRVRVRRIDVYRRDVPCLYQGYTGTLFVSVVHGACPEVGAYLTDE
jgi:hypothetical protein